MELTFGETGRLVAFTKADTKAVFDLIRRNRAHLDRWLRWSGTLEGPDDVEKFLGMFEVKQAAGDGFHCGIFDDGILAGGLVCWYIHPQNRNAEIGYWLGEQYVGRGLATRAAAEGIRYLFEDLGLHRIEMQCGVGNRASRAIPERLGFTMEGVRRQSHWITDRFVDHAVYGLLRSEWWPECAVEDDKTRRR